MCPGGQRKGQMTSDHSSLAAGSDATNWDQGIILEGSFCSDGESR